ncbi:MAG: ribokinase [Bacteroidales bacterium]|nr:ribokinase [Bacteroidales bacterium]
MSHKKNILVIGSSNTDMTVLTGKMPAPGETVLGGEFRMGAGGKGANQAVAAARLGADVSFVCKLGRDVFGDNAVEGYRREGLDVSGILRCDSPSGIAVITVDASAENCIVVAPGANARITPEDMDSLKAKFESASILLVQLEIPVETVLRAMEMAREAGMTVVLNPAPACALPGRMLELTDLLIPNQTELSMLSGLPVTDETSAAAAAKVLMEKGISNVIVTLGSKGSLVCRKGGEPVMVPARKVKAVDTTAAGDTFCGAVCTGLTEGMDLGQAVRFATAASSLTVQKPGAQDSLPYRKEVDKIL